MEKCACRVYLVGGFVPTETDPLVVTVSCSKDPSVSNSILDIEGAKDGENKLEFRRSGSVFLRVLQLRDARLRLTKRRSTSNSTLLPNYDYPEVLVRLLRFDQPCCCKKL